MRFRRVLVANRGEVAVRVIRALHELGIEAVAVYSTADRGALHTRLADRAVCVGPPAASESYLNIASLVGAAETTGCDAVHPGWGFLAESSAFVCACVDNDLVFVGPSAETMERAGDKALAKAELARVGVPLVPGTEGRTTLAEARAAAQELGYPVRRHQPLPAIREPPVRPPVKRARHRDRRRPCAARDRGRRAARADRPRAAPRARDRGADQRGGSRARLRAVARGRRALPAAAR